MSARILLINPWEPSVFPPPAIGYLQAALKHCLPDAQVTARDLPEALALLASYQYDFVGVSFHSFSVKNAQLIRERVKHGRLVCGGHHPSSSIGRAQLEALGYEVIAGEGEEALVNLVAGTPQTARFCNIEALPFPDYAGLSGQWEDPGAGWGYPVISSRGCPFRCSFCASSAFWRRQWRPRSAEGVVAELTELMMAGCRSWMYEDDNFTLNPSRAITICNMIGEQLVPMFGPVSWQCASRAEQLVHPELCLALRAAGCHTVWLGIESLSQGSLDRCHKDTTVAPQLQGVRTAAIHGLRTWCQFIAGLPGDTQADIDETCRQIRQSPMSIYGANIAWVLPDTEIHAEAKKRGFDDAVYLSHGAPYYAVPFGEQSMETLLIWREQINNAKGKSCA